MVRAPAWRRLVLFGLLAAPSAARAAEAHPPRVVMLVLRGTAFERAPAALGGHAVPLVPIDGAVTAASLATLFTGASPDRHGLVGNVYREGFDGEERDAFAERMLAEPLWEAAERQDRRVAALNLRLPGYAHDGVVATWTQRPETGAGRHEAEPAAFARELDERVGLAPGPANLAGLLDGSLPAASFADQIERWALHRREDLLHVLRHSAFDLLIVDENVIDAMLHPFTGRDERQVRRAYRLAGETLVAVQRALPERSVLVVVSPYGMAPVRTAVPLGRTLKDAGFNVDGPGAEVRIAAYGPVAHVSVAPGVDSGAIETALRGLRDADGAALIDRVERRVGKRTLPLFHPIRGGDLVALAAPGVVLSAEEGPVKPRFPGDHGFASTTPGARGFFIAHRPGHPLRLPKAMSDVDVAPTLACLLGVAAPRNAQGNAHNLTASKAGCP